MEFLKKLELSNDVHALLDSIRELQKKYHTIESGVVHGAIQALKEYVPDITDVEILVRLCKLRFQVEPWPNFWYGIRKRGNVLTEATIHDYILKTMGEYPNVYGKEHWKMRSMILENRPQYVDAVVRRNLMDGISEVFHKDYVVKNVLRTQMPAQVCNGDTIHLIMDERGSSQHCRNGRPIGVFLGGHTFGLGEYVEQEGM